MAKLYDHKSKKWLVADDDKVDELVRSGDYTFEQGQTIPVVAPDGELMDLPAENATAAFRDGFRWKTSADVKKWEQDGLADIQRENFGNASQAGVAGFLRGSTLGASDIIMPAIAPLLGGSAKDVRAGLGALKEESPTASTVGQVAGVVTSSMLPTTALGAAGGLAAKAKTGAETIATGLNAGKLGKNVAGLAAEGAVWGFGEGVSESALTATNPNEVVDNLVSNVGLGALTGGLFGGALTGGQVAAPYLKGVLDTSLTATNKVGNKLTRGIAKMLVKPTMTLRGQGEVYEQFKNVIDDETLRKAIASGDVEGLEALAKENTVITKELTKESKALSKSLKDQISRATSAERDEIVNLLSAADQDVTQALTNAQMKLEDIGKGFDEYKSTLTGAPAFGEPLIKSIDKKSVSLGKYGSESKALSNEIRNITKAYGTNLTEGTELQMIRDIKSLVSQEARKDLKGAAHEEAKKLWSEMDNILKKKHPNSEVTRYMGMYDTVYGARANLSKAFNASTKRGGGIENLLFSPATQVHTAKFMNNLKEFIPELEVIRQSGKDIGKRTAAFNALEAKYMRIAKDKISPENIDDFKAIVNELVADPKVLSNVNRVDDIMRATQGLDTLNPYDATVRLHNVLGKDTKGLEKYARIGQEWSAIQALKGVRQGEVGVGDAVMATITGGASLPITMARRAGSNPYNTVRMVGKIEEASKKGKDLLIKASEKMSKSLISEPVRATTTTLKAKSENTKERQSRYNQVRKTVAELANPQNMSAAIEQSTGGLPGMSNIKLAVALRLQNATSYLIQELPSNPLAQVTIGPSKDLWRASDTEIARYMRKVDAVNNPLIVASRVEDGTVTMDELNALKNVHPDVYNQLQESINNAIMTFGDQIPYSRRVQLGTLFSLPTDYSITPAFITSMQAPFSPMDQGGRPEGSKSNQNIDISPFDSVQTETSKITYKS
jgi:hypothetical protein